MAVSIFFSVTFQIAFYFVSITVISWWLYHRRGLRDSLVFVLVLGIGGLLSVVPFVIRELIAPSTTVFLGGRAGSQLTNSFAWGMIPAIFPAMLAVLFRFCKRPEITEFDGIKKRSWLVLTIFVGILYLVPIIFIANRIVNGFFIDLEID